MSVSLFIRGGFFCVFVSMWRVVENSFDVDSTSMFSPKAISVRILSSVINGIVFVLA